MKETGAELVRVDSAGHYVPIWNPYFDGPWPWDDFDWDGFTRECEALVLELGDRVCSYLEAGENQWGEDSYGARLAHLEWALRRDPAQPPEVGSRVELAEFVDGLFR